jgi:hypothetical protein
VGQITQFDRIVLKAAADEQSRPTPNFGGYQLYQVARGISRDTAVFFAALPPGLLELRYAVATRCSGQCKTRHRGCKQTRATVDLSAGELSPHLRAILIAARAKPQHIASCSHEDVAAEYRHDGRWQCLNHGGMHAVIVSCSDHDDLAKLPKRWRGKRQ